MMNLRTTGMLALLIGAAVLLNGCCCGDDEDKYDCWASTDMGGGAVGSRSMNADRKAAAEGAREGVCIAYCEYQDPSVDKAFKAFKKTPKGKKSNTRRSFDVDFQKEIKPVYKKCLSKCERTRAADSIRFSEQCAFPASGKSCTAKIKYKKKKVSATARGELTALLNACGSFCEKNDKNFKKAYKKEKKRDKTVTLGENKKLLPEYQTCRMKCMHQMVKKPKNQDISCP